MPKIRTGSRKKSNPTPGSNRPPAAGVEAVPAVKGLWGGEEASVFHSETVALLSVGHSTLKNGGGGRMSQTSSSKNSLGQVKRCLNGGLLISLVAVVGAGAMTIPFFYQSQTLWYKLGIDKLLLLAGQLAGLLAALALFLQILVGTRGKGLEEIFGVALLMRFHRVNGVVLCGLAAAHVTLVQVPEGIANLPIGVKYWPELVGVTLLLLLFLTTITAWFRQQLGLVYRRWQMMHRMLGYLALALVAVHVLFVADSFTHRVPQVALLIALAAVVSRVLGVKSAARRRNR
jgi:hypothetical protein